MTNNSINQLIDKHIEILTILNDKDNHQLSKLVGGCVRDFLLSKKISTDTDISTILSPNDVKKRIFDYKNNNKNENIVLLDKDQEYGTIIVILNGIHYEITTTRSDISCFGRQANVKFCKDFFTDSQRRDFTINALYMDINGNIYDFHNGLQDLQQKKIVFIGDAKTRIQEDYLRIIRFVRFSTKFNSFDIDKKIYNVIQETKDGILKLSYERIRSEVFKILEYDNWLEGLCFFEKNNLLEEVFKIPSNTEIQTNYNHFFDKNDKKNNKIVRLFYFFNYNFSIISSFIDTLRLTNEEKKVLKTMNELFSEFQNFNKSSMRDDGNRLSLVFKYKLFNKNNNEIIENILPLFPYKIQNDITAFLTKKKPLPISSDFLISKGYNGKALGGKIKELTMIWIEENFIDNDFTNHIKV